MEPFTVAAGSFEWTVAGATSKAVPGPITTSSALAVIMDDPQAYETVMSAFTRISPDLAREFTKRTAWLPNEPLIGGFTLISPAVAAEIESSLAGLNESRGH
jgi:alpha-L-rhamnosidase